MADEPFVLVLQRSIEPPEQFEALGPDLGEDDASIFGRPLPADQAGGFQAVEKAGDPRHLRDETIGDLEARKRFSLAAEMRRTLYCEGVRPYFRKSRVMLVWNRSDVRNRLSRASCSADFERMPLLELGLQSSARILRSPPICMPPTLNRPFPALHFIDT